MENTTGQEILDAIDGGMREVAPKLESGEIDGSGRFWTDDELARGAATSGRLPSAPPSKASAA
jgi:hypothetical protein